MKKQLQEMQRCDLQSQSQILTALHAFAQNTGQDSPRLQTCDYVSKVYI